jgi:exopolysaccharide production protein ExoZ
MNATFESNKSINGLQYLRGIAALMVVFHHSLNYFDDVANWTDIGARGVNIFFVISGFIMAYTTKQVQANSSALTESAVFLSKRFIRVVPLYWVALLWTSSRYWIPWLDSSDSLKELYWNLNTTLVTVAEDFIFIPHYSISVDLPNKIYPILIPGWTINYEIFFYFIFGISILAGRYRLLLASIVMLMLVAIGQIYQFSDAIYNFYTSSVLIDFVFGMIVYVIHKKTHNLSFGRLNFLVLGALGCFLLYIGAQLLYGLVTATAAAIIVWNFIHMFHNYRNGILKLLGDASYSIYLFHVASFSLVESLVNSIGLSADGMINIFMIIILHISVATIVGIAIYLAVEKPLLKILRHILMRTVSAWKSPVSQFASSTTP